MKWGNMGTLMSAHGEGVWEGPTPGILGAGGGHVGQVVGWSDGGLVGREVILSVSRLCWRVQAQGKLWTGQLS